MPTTLASDTLAPSTLTPLILDFLEWLAAAPRPHAEVMEAWRTSCPRLTVWEDSVDLGFVARQGGMAELTADGRRFLAQSGRSPTRQEQ